MKIGLYSNKLKDTYGRAEKTARQTLSEHGFECVAVSDGGELCSGGVDILCVLGGDGTILNIAPICAKLEIPILGINTGTLGFLSEAEPKDMARVAEALENGAFTVENRAMLAAELNGQTYTALNEFVVTRRTSEETMSKVITVDTFVGDVFTDRYVGDGVIVCTPTGSTAYSLSAGGAVMSPQVEAFQITSICPHTLHTRPIVVSDKEKIELKILSKERSALLVADGVICGEIGESVCVRKAEKCAKFIKLNEVSFYSKLLQKLNKWSTIKR